MIAVAGQGFPHFSFCDRAHSRWRLTVTQHVAPARARAGWRPTFHLRGAALAMARHALNV